MLQTEVVEKIKTHILCPVTFVEENRAFYETMWRSMAEPDTPRMTNMAHVRRMLDTEGYKHTLRTRSIYCFPPLQ
jgi:hypothetical protein